MNTAARQTESPLPPVPESLGHLLARAVVRALCGHLGSEISFGEPYLLTSPSISQNRVVRPFSGTLAGSLGLSCDTYALRTLASGLKMNDPKGYANIPETLSQIFSMVSKAVESQLHEEDLGIQFQERGTVKENEEIPPDPSTLVVPIETKYGTLRLYLHLSPESVTFLTDQLGEPNADTERKIRVSGGQLEILEQHLQRVASLEEKILKGPQIRAQIRRELALMRRLLHELRTEPLHLLFSPARQIILDISKKRGKQIQLIIEGAWPTLDKSLLNHLYTPIQHLVRNAADHGIEEPLERERIGKPAGGYIKCLISFTEEGLRIRISDDGRGLNIEQIRRHAVSRGLLDAKESLELSEEEIAPLIFEPGFSTKTKADAISGSGLGLDSVRKNLEPIQGEIQLLSTSHHGSSFEIFVPLRKNLSKVTKETGEFGNEASERKSLFIELENYFDRLHRLEKELGPKSERSTFYEIYRVLDSIRGICGFFAWNRVIAFCQSLEELAKELAHDKITLTTTRIHLIQEASKTLRQFVEASRNEDTFPLYEVVKLEGKILRCLWSGDTTIDKGPLAIAQIHLKALRSFIGDTAKFRSNREKRFTELYTHPFGAFVQLQGEQQGFLGLLFAEKTLKEGAPPLLPSSGSMTTRLSHLGQNLDNLGKRVADLAHLNGLSFQVSTAIPFYGQAKALRVLGPPTHSFACRVEEAAFHIFGDLRQGGPIERMAPREGNSIPIERIFPACLQRVKHYFKQLGIAAHLEEKATQSELVGWENGWTSLLLAEGNPNVLLFLSYEDSLATQVSQRAMETNPAQFIERDEIFNLNQLGTYLSEQLGQSHLKSGLVISPQPATTFYGRFHLANFTPWYINKMAEGTTDEGSFQIRLFVGEFQD